MAENDKWDDLLNENEEFSDAIDSLTDAIVSAMDMDALKQNLLEQIQAHVESGAESPFQLQQGSLDWDKIKKTIVTISDDVYVELPAGYEERWKFLGGEEVTMIERGTRTNPANGEEEAEFSTHCRIMQIREEDLPPDPWRVLEIMENHLENVLGSQGTSMRFYGRCPAILRVIPMDNAIAHVPSYLCSKELLLLVGSYDGQALMFDCGNCYRNEQDATLIAALSGMVDVLMGIRVQGETLDTAHVGKRDIISRLLGEACAKAWEQTDNAGKPAVRISIENASAEKGKPRSEPEERFEISADDVLEKYNGMDNVVVVPDGVKRITHSAFEGKKNIEVLYLHDSVEELDSLALHGMEKLRKVVLSAGMKKIELQQFQDLPCLEEVVIPDGVREIGLDAFENCPALQRIELPESVEIINASFRNCAGLRNVVLSPNMETLPALAFHDLPALEEVVIPEGVRIVEDGAFRNCPALQQVVFPDSVQELGRAFANCRNIRSVGLPAGIEILESVCSDLPALEEIEIPDGVRKIAEYAFSGCAALRQIELPDSVQAIGDGAFSGCGNLQRIRLSAGMTVLERNTFFDLPALEEVILPQGLRKVEENAFFNCPRLKEIVFPDSISEIEKRAIVSCKSVQRIVYPAGLKAIPDIFGAMSMQMKALAQVIVREGAEELGDWCFYGCSKLTDVRLPGTLKRIGAGVFCDCTGLERLCVPENVESIGSAALGECRKLKDLYLPASVTQIAENALRDCSKKLVIHAPKGSYAERFALQNGKTVVNDYRPPEYEQEEAEEPQPQQTAPRKKRYETPRSAFDIDENGVLKKYKGTQKMVVLPEGIAEIADWVFSSSEIESVDFPESLRKIANYAFYDCEKLSRIEWSSGLEEIGSDAFNGCSSLTEIELPEGLCKLGLWAFDGCAHVNKVVFPSALKRIDLQDEITSKPLNLSTVIVKPGAEVIRGECFAYCINLRKVELPETLRVIERWAFYSCASLKELNIPQGVTQIDRGAFSVCKRLEKIVLPGTLRDMGEDCFTGDNALRTVAFAEGLEELPAQWLQVCMGRIRDLYLPASLQRIDEQALEGHASDLVVHAPEGSYAEQFARQQGIAVKNDYSVERALDTEIRNPDTSEDFTATEGIWHTSEALESIEENKFFCNETLRYAVIPEGVTQIEGHAFAYCKNLKAVSLPETLRVIEVGAFEGCTALESVILPEGLEEIEISAFDGCKQLRLMVIPGSVKQFDGSIFDNDCENLRDIYLSGSTLPPDDERRMHLLEHACYHVQPGSRMAECVKNLEGKYDYNAQPPEQKLDPVVERVLNRYQFRTDDQDVLTEYAGSKKDVVLPAYVRGMAEGAFAGSEIVSVALPEGIKTIESNVFARCGQLETVALPSGLERICSAAFAGCERLGEITIPGTVRRIESNAFAGCTALKRVVLMSGETLVVRGAMEDGVTLKVPLGYYAHLEEGAEAWSVECYPAEFRINEEGILLRYTGGSAQVHVPLGVRSIGAGAFAPYGSAVLGSARIYLSDTVETVSSGAASPQAEYVAPEGKYLTCDAESTLWRVAPIPQGMRLDYRQALIGYTGAQRQMQIPLGVTGIGAAVFKGSAVEKVVLSETVRSIGPEAFAQCGRLQSVRLPLALETVHVSAFDPETIVEVPAWKRVEWNVDRSLVRLAGETKSQNVTPMPFKALLLNDDDFTVDANLTLTLYKGRGAEVVVPEGVKCIGSNAFQTRGAWMESLALPGSLDAIQQGAFSKCSALREVSIKGNLRTLPPKAFSGCTKLSKVVLLESVKKIGDHAFENCAIHSITLPASIREIGEGAFAGTNLTALTIPEGTVRLGAYAFQNCAMLEKVFLPASVVELSPAAFERMKVKKVTVFTPESSHAAQVLLKVKSVKLIELDTNGNEVKHSIWQKLRGK